MQIKISSPNKSIMYTDTEDHFKNGLLRLLSMTECDFHQWLSLSEKYNNDNVLLKLLSGYMEMYPTTHSNLNIKVEPGPQGENGHILYEYISENNNFGIASSDKIAWLAQNNNGKFVRVVDPPKYEEEYFEGDRATSGGYGDYAAQLTWRLEKANRQVKELSDITNLKSGYVLDTGSGYGYFRKGLDDAGFKHEGIEVSKFANEASQNTFGFNSYLGTIFDYSDQFQNKFDAVFLGDVIEHVPDPVLFLKEINKVLVLGGFVVIKTPNLDCPEAVLFGNRYHSFKREHLTYFTNESLIDYAKEASLNHYKSTSISHLLVGFVGQEKVKEWSDNLKGSDLVCYFKK